MASRGMPDQSNSHDEQTTTYRRCVRDDRYPALLQGIDKAASRSNNVATNSFIGDDVEKLYDFTAATDGGHRGVACPSVTDYPSAGERAASAVDVGRTLALFGADRLYQSTAASLACPLCVHSGSAAWTREAVYVERRPAARHDHDHDADCPLHAKSSTDIASRWQEHQQTEMAMYPPGLRSPDQQQDHDASRSQ